MRSMLVTALAFSVFVVACSKNEDKGPTTAPSSSARAATGPASPPAASTAATPQAPAAAVDVSPDMKAFMAMLDGGDKSAGNALKKYGAKEVQDNDLGMYKLQSPTVVAMAKEGALTCYTMKSSAGIMKHTSNICWDAKG